MIIFGHRQLKPRWECHQKRSAMKWNSSISKHHQAKCLSLIVPYDGMPGSSSWLIWSIWRENRSLLYHMCHCFTVQHDAVYNVNVIVIISSNLLMISKEFYEPQLMHTFYNKWLFDSSMGQWNLAQNPLTFYLIWESKINHRLNEYCQRKFEVVVKQSWDVSALRNSVGFESFESPFLDKSDFF